MQLGNTQKYPLLYNSRVMRKGILYVCEAEALLNYLSSSSVYVYLPSELSLTGFSPSVL